MPKQKKKPPVKPQGKPRPPKPGPKKPKPEAIIELKQRVFLAAFRTTASVRHAATAAGVARTRHYRWLENPHYAARFEQARDAAAQVLEDEAVRRAREGTEEPVFYQGEECATILRYSDALLMFLLRGWRPERYRDRSEISGPGGGPIPIDSRLIPLADVLKPDELQRIRTRLAGKSG